MFLEALKFTGIILGMFAGGYVFVWLWSKALMFYMNKTMYLTGKKAYIVHGLSIVVSMYVLICILLLFE